eukprot:gene8899-9850_t
METEITDLHARCPAFTEKCPFDKPELKPLMEEAKQCPAFKDTCTFKNMTTIEEVYQKLSDIPDVKEGSVHEKAIAEILKVIHNVSKELKEEMGECPVFKSKAGCPFKTLCSDGKPLLEKLKEFHLEYLIHDAAIKVKEDLEKNLKEKESKMDDEKDEQDELKLSSHLKNVLSKKHREASSSHFIRELLKGRVDQKIYQQYIASLYFIYVALEDEAEKHADHPVFKQIHCPEDLAKVDLIKKDLEYYFGEDWEDKISISEATQNYVDRLHEVAEIDPFLLVAHHYIRYVGDLSGAQVVKKVAIKTYKLPESGDGVRYYEFKNIANFMKYKDEYRAKLDAMKVGCKNADRLVEEATMAYNLNVHLFQELDQLAGFEAEIVHEEVDIGDEKKNITTKDAKDSRDVSADYQPEGMADAEAVIKGGRSTDASAKNESEEANSPYEWLRILAAVAIALAVLVGFVMKMTDVAKA